MKSHSELIIAEGYLFEFIRRGRVRAGSNVPEVVIDYPDHVRALSQEFVDAGSDVVQAFTVSPKFIFPCVYHRLTSAQRYISSSLCSRFSAVNLDKYRYVYLHVCGRFYQCCCALDTTANSLAQ